jgi:hypothetical protein
MSKYYNIEGEKVRVSDHEPNVRLNGSCDIYIWSSDACGNRLSIGGQIDRICDKLNLEITSFSEVIKDFADTDEECRFMLEIIK